MRQTEFTVACLSIILTGISLGHAVDVDPAEVEKMFPLPQDDWLNLEIMDTKAGYAHIFTD